MDATGSPLAPAPIAQQDARWWKRCCVCCSPTDLPHRLAPLVLLLIAIVATLPGWMPGRTYAPLDALRQFAPWGSADYRPHNPVLLDQTVQFAPWAKYAAERWRAGDVPLWNPHQQLGAPLLGNGQSAVFYPTTFLHAALPQTWSWTLAATLKLWIAGLGVWMLLGRFGASPWARLMGGVLFMLCGYNIVWLNHPHTNTAVLLPWAIVALQWLVDRPSTARLATASLVFALQFLGGHPASSIHLLLICGLVYLADLTLLRPRQAARAIPAAVVALIAGAFLAGAQLLPLWDYISDSAAQVVRQQELAARPAISFSPAYLLGTLFPYINGYPPDRIAPYQMSLATGLPNTNELAGGFVGTLGLLLAILAIIRRRDRVVFTWAGIALVAASIAIGLPGFDHLARLIPGLNVAQNARLTLGLALGLSILAALGLDCLLRDFGSHSLRASAGTDPLAPRESAGSDSLSLRERAGVRGGIPEAPSATQSRLASFCRWGAIALASLAVLGAVSLLILRKPITSRGKAAIQAHFQSQTGPRESTPEHWNAVVERIHGELVLTSARLLIPAAVLAAAWLILASRANRPRLAASPLTWIGLAAIELLAFAFPYNVGSCSRDVWPTSPAIDWLKARLAESPQAFRVAGRFSAFYPEAATGYGLSDIRGYDAISHLRTWQFMDRIDPQPDRQADVKRLMNTDSPALNLLSLKYLLTAPTPRHAPAAPWVRAYPAPDVAADIAARADAWIYENPQALPRFWMSARPVWHETSAEILDRIASAQRIGPPTTRPSTQPSPDFDPRQTVLLDRQLPVRTKELADANVGYLQTAGSGAGTVRVVEDTPHRIRLQVDGPGGWLVVADSFDKGWVCNVARGSPSDKGYRKTERVILPAYGALRAIPLPDTRGSTVILEYRPESFRDGIFASAGGGALVLILYALALLSGAQKTTKEGAT